MRLLKTKPIYFLYKDSNQIIAPGKTCRLLPEDTHHGAVKMGSGIFNTASEDTDFERAGGDIENLNMLLNNRLLHRSMGKRGTLPDERIRMQEPAASELGIGVLGTEGRD